MQGHNMFFFNSFTRVYESHYLDTTWFITGEATAAASQPAFYDAYKVPNPEDDLGPPSGSARPFAKLPPISARLSAEELSGNENGHGRTSSHSNGYRNSGNNHSRGSSGGNGGGSSGSGGYGRVMVEETTVSPLLAYTPPSVVDSEEGESPA